MSSLVLMSSICTWRLKVDAQLRQKLGRRDCSQARQNAGQRYRIFKTFLAVAGLHRQRRAVTRQSGAVVDDNHNDVTTTFQSVENDGGDVDAALSDNGGCFFAIK
jgi:hypothetical protein